VNERSPTRAALLELQDERHAMREGHVFLDEKCLLLAGEMLRQLERHAALEKDLLAAHDTAMGALQAALARHGLHGLQVQPPDEIDVARIEARKHSLMGVTLQEAAWSGRVTPAAPSVAPSPEARECRAAFAALLAAAVPLAAASGNLERLSQEYRRSLRRARALQDVLLPELERDLRGIDSALEELDQQDLVSMRRRPAAAAAGSA
jgi:V/A-type H+-transporting ATPase subunit D